MSWASQSTAITFYLWSYNKMLQYIFTCKNIELNVSVTFPFPSRTHCNATTKPRLENPALKEHSGINLCLCCMFNRIFNFFFLIPRNSTFTCDHVLFLWGINMMLHTCKLSLIHHHHGVVTLTMHIFGHLELNSAADSSSNKLHVVWGFKKEAVHFLNRTSTCTNLRIFQNIPVWKCVLGLIPSFFPRVGILYIFYDYGVF